MLVVIAITIVLMGLLLGPLSQSFRLTARGRAMIAAQDNARSAMNQITRDIQDAMAVYDGLPIWMYGYNRFAELDGRPHPDDSSQAALLTYPGTNQPIEYRDAMIDLVLPKARYYCTAFNHYLTEEEVAPNQAIEECPRAGHQNSKVETRPIQPLQPAGTRVRYFVGLRYGYNPGQLDPGVPDSQNRRAPHYLNPQLFTMTTGELVNPYVLYRAEFDPQTTSQLGQSTSNWRDASGQINPGFFYPDVRTGDDRFARAWKNQAVAIIPPENTDMVRWVQDRQRPEIWLPQPMTRFGATAIESETLDPNRETVTPDGQGGFREAARPPMQYVADYGHWTGPPNDLTIPLAPSVIISPTAPAANIPADRFALGPRFQIYDTQSGGGGTAMTLVYDSAVTAADLPRRRLFTWDSSRGIVNFALRAETTQSVQGVGSVGDEVPYSISLLRDRQTRDLPLVSNLGRTEPIAAGFGSVKADPYLTDTVRIVPGSERVEQLGSNGQPERTFERAGWTGTGRDMPTPQPDLELDQYVIDYSTGLIAFSDRDPRLAGIPVRIRYQMHTNKSTDVVRVSYSTRELLTVNVGLLQYEVGSGEAQEIQISNRLRLRNLTR
jgi:hypothetical protein